MSDGLELIVALALIGFKNITELASVVAVAVGVEIGIGGKCDYRMDRTRIADITTTCIVAVAEADEQGWRWG